MKAILVVLACVFGYLAYTASYMNELGIAVGMGAVSVACLWGAISGGKARADKRAKASSGQ